MTASERRQSWRNALGVLGLILGIVAVVALVNGEPPIFSGIFLGFTLGGVVWNELLGPGCHTYVVTGVQTARLPSLVRMKKARRVLGRLQPLIEAAQADLVAAPIALLPVITPLPLAGGEPPVMMPPGPPPLA